MARPLGAPLQDEAAGTVAEELTKLRAALVRSEQHVSSLVGRVSTACAPQVCNFCIYAGIFAILYRAVLCYAVLSLG